MSVYRQAGALARLAPCTPWARLVWAWLRGAHRRMRRREVYRRLRTSWNFEWMPRRTLKEWAAQDDRRRWRETVLAASAMFCSLLWSFWSTWNGDHH